MTRSSVDRHVRGHVTGLSIHPIRPITQLMMIDRVCTDQQQPPGVIALRLAGGRGMWEFIGIALGHKMWRK